MENRIENIVKLFIVAGVIAVTSYSWSQLSTLYHHQQNKCYSKRCHIVMKSDSSNKFDCKIKFATAKIECSFKMGK